jgi:hypothetical protein
MSIKLSQPKAYGRILPLANSQREPIRPRPVQLSAVVVPEIKDRPNCRKCPTQACKTGRCDWPEEDAKAVNVVARERALPPSLPHLERS